MPVHNTMGNEAEVKQYLVFVLPAVAAMLAPALWLSLPVGPVTALMAEAGGIETATLFAYGAAIVAVCLTLLVAADRLARAAILLLLLFLGAREMDFHMSLTGTSVLRFSYFFKGAVSAEKAGALAAVAVVLACIGYLWLRHGADFRRGVRTGQPRRRSSSACRCWWYSRPCNRAAGWPRFSATGAWAPATHAAGLSSCCRQKGCAAASGCTRP